MINFSNQQPYFKSDMCFYAYRYGYNPKVNVIISFPGPNNMGKDTKIDFLLQILRKLWVFKILLTFLRRPILFFAHKKNCP